MEPLVSICIPAYNAALFIQQTLESALGQTYPNLEIIVSDDRSTDNTLDIVNEFASRGVKIIQPDHNLGRYGNCNAVIRASRGKYVMKLDADDLLDPVHVKEQIAVLEAHPEISFAHCACRLIDINGKLIGYERSIHGSFIRSGMEEWPRYVFGPRAVNIVTLRREAYDRVGGYDERYRYSGDWAMHRSLLRVGSVFYNDQVIASYRSHRLGKQGVKLLQAQEHLMHFEDMERNWPLEVPGKDKLLSRARVMSGFTAATTAAYCSGSEKVQILSLIPQYSRDWRLLCYAAFIQSGGSPFVRGVRNMNLRVRQIIKQVLYQPGE